MSSTLSYKNIFRVATPIMVSGIAQNIINVTDTAFLGNVGRVALGAAGNAGIFYFVLIVTGMGFTTGAQIIIGRRNGEKQYQEIGNVFNQTLLFIMPLAIGLFIILKFLSPGFLGSIVQSKDILKSAIGFLSYRSYGVFFAFMIFTFNAFYVGTTDTRILIWGTLVTMVTNVFLDYALIFGNFGFPEMGVEGAAIASSCAEVTTFFFILIYTYFHVDLNKYQLFKWKGFNRTIFTRLFKVGGPVMLQNFLSLSSWFIFFMIIEKMGEKELAASHIIRSIYMVLMIPLFGFSAATNTLVSNLIGQGEARNVLKLIGRLLVISLATTVLTLLINIIAPNYILHLYTQDETLIKLAYSGLKVLNFSMFFFCVAFILFNGVTGTGNTLISMFIEFITILVYLAGAYLIAVKWQHSLTIVWCSEFIYFILLAFLSFLYLKFGKWSQTKL